MKTKRRSSTSKLEDIIRAEGEFTQTLEQNARALIKERERRPTGFAITKSIEQEIAFTLEQLDRLRAVQKGQFRSLLQAECYTGTELKQMEERTPRYSPDRFPERHKFQQRLFMIDAERRKHSVSHEERIQILQKKLLSLMQKYESLSVGT